MKHIFLQFKVLILIFLCIGIYSCSDTTKVGDIDLNFKQTIDNPDIKTYQGEPIYLNLKVELADKNNTYPLTTTPIFKTGQLYYNGEEIKPNKELPFDLKNDGVMQFMYIPESDNETVEFRTKNELVTRKTESHVATDGSLYDLNVGKLPEKMIINQKFNFQLELVAKDQTGDKKLKTYAKILKGAGSIFIADKELKDSIQGDSLLVGNNNLSYQASQEGDNTIRFYLKNKWGVTTYKDVAVKISLPGWNVTNSAQKDTVKIPYKDNYSFSLNVNENDILKDNSYTCSFRSLTNSELTLKVNDTDIQSGKEFPLKAGGNVGILNVSTPGVGGLEFIVKDKFKQERRDTLNFKVNLPIKPIQMKLDNTVQTVKVNQPAIFKMNLSEENYSDEFDVLLTLIDGKGTFDNGDHFKIAPGDNTIQFTPTTGGKCTFKITISDKNKQSTEQVVTVNSELSAINASLSSTEFENTVKDPAKVLLTVNEKDYNGIFSISYIPKDIKGTDGHITVNNQPLGKGGVVILQHDATINAVPIEIKSDADNETDYDFKIIDQYGQFKDLNLKDIVMKDKYTITITSNEGGTVSGGGSLDYNTNAELKAVANIGHTFVNWTEDGTEVSKDNPYVFVVKKNRIITANFKIDKLNVILNATDGGTVTGSGTFDYDSNVTINAVPKDGYAFDGWYDGTTMVSQFADYTFKLEKETRLTAHFKINTYSIETNATDGGSASGGGTFNYGSNVTVNAVPSVGHHFVAWYEGSTQISTTPSYTFTATANRALTAHFDIDKITVQVNATDGGSASGGGTFNYGSNVTVVASQPQANYGYFGWFNNDQQITTDLSYQFSATQNISLTAKYGNNVRLTFDYENYTKGYLTNKFCASMREGQGDWGTIIPAARPFNVQVQAYDKNKGNTFVITITVSGDEGSYDLLPNYGTDYISFQKIISVGNDQVHNPISDTYYNILTSEGKGRGNFQ